MGGFYMPFIGPDGHRHWVAAIHVSHLQPVLPTVYDESLSYYEVLCKLQYKINEVIAALDQETDERIEADTHLANLIAELRKYAEQIEIKLTEMIQNEIDRAMQNELRIEQKFKRCYRIHEKSIGRI